MPTVALNGVKDHVYEGLQRKFQWFINVFFHVVIQRPCNVWVDQLKEGISPHIVPFDVPGCAFQCGCPVVTPYYNGRSQKSIFLFACETLKKKLCVFERTLGFSWWIENVIKYTK